MGAVAEIIKIDADILSLTRKLAKKNRRDLKERIAELSKKRQMFLVELEKQMRKRVP